MFQIQWVVFRKYDPFLQPMSICLGFMTSDLKTMADTQQANGIESILLKVRAKRLVNGLHDWCFGYCYIEEDTHLRLQFFFLNTLLSTWSLTGFVCFKQYFQSVIISLCHRLHAHGMTTQCSNLLSSCTVETAQVAKPNLVWGDAYCCIGHLLAALVCMSVCLMYVCECVNTKFD